jgi:hypothetical protein
LDFDPYIVDVQQIGTPMVLFQCVVRVISCLSCMIAGSDF